MQIVDNTPKKQSLTTTLAEIPVGTTFRGIVSGSNGIKKYYGIFYKHFNRCILTRDAPVRVADCIVIRLKKLDDNIETYNHGCWTWSAVVEDYEPLDVELVVKGVKR